MAVTIEDLKNAVKIEDVIRLFGRFYLPSRSARNIKCTQHDSFVVDTVKQYYFWNSQSRGGSVIDYLINEEKMGMADALKWLQDKTGLELAMSDEARRETAVRRHREEILLIIARYLYKALQASGEAMGWLEGRGWKDGVASRARIGYWDGTARELLAYLHLHQIEANEPTVRAVLDIPKRMICYTHWKKGRCVYMTFRAIDDVEKGYRHRKLAVDLVGQQHPYWNHAQGVGKERVVVVEGQADAISLGEWGIHGVAMAGVAMADCGVASYDSVVVGVDSDDAGQKATENLAEQLLDLGMSGLRVRVATWPAKDVNEWHQQGASADDAKKVIDDAVPYVVWLARHCGKSANDEAKLPIAKRVAAIAHKLDSMEYALIRERIIEATKLSPSVWDAIMRGLRDDREDREETAKRLAVHGRDVASKRVINDKFSADQLQMLTSASWDHEGHAECTKMLFGEHLAFVPKWGWVAYNGTHWSLDGGEHIAQNCIMDTIKARRDLAIADGNDTFARKCTGSYANVSSTLRLLERKVLSKTTAFNADPDLLCVGNGVVDLRTGTISPHDAKYKFMYCIETSYRTEEEVVEGHCDWLMFLLNVTSAKGIFGESATDKTLIDWLQMAVGYSLTGHTRENCLFYLYGPTRSGKGTFTNTLLTLLGSPLSASVPFKVFTDTQSDPQNFTFAPLQPCRFIAGSEPNKNERFNDGLVKSLTGEDVMRCSFKGQDQFEYLPKFKIWLSSNWPFNADPADTAAWGRARIVHFPNSFLGEEDKGLKQRLGKKESLEGVLYWAVQGAVKWYASDNGLQSPEAVKAAGLRQRAEQDFIQQFLDEVCESADPSNGSSFALVSDVHKVYTTWCHDNGVTPLQSRSFGLAMKNKNFVTDRRYVGGRQQRGYVGVKINSKIPLQEALF